MNYKIVTDSSSNLLKLEGDADFASVPLRIITDQREFVDDDTLNVTEMVDFLKSYKGKSSTACPGVQDYLDAFGDADTIFCFTITSTLSGSYNAARLAKEDYEALYPESRVLVVDSLSVGPEVKLFVEKLQELAAEGKDFTEICEALNIYQQRTALLFSLESMQNLANNGRVSPAVAKIAGLLGIRAIGCASQQGDLEMLDKSRGEKKALLSIVKHLKSIGYSGGKVRIDHCDNIGAAEQLKQLILNDFADADIRIAKATGLCSFYAEKGGLLIGFEKNN